MNIKHAAALFLVAAFGVTLGASGVTAFQNEQVVGSINIYATASSGDRNDSIDAGAVITLDGETGSITTPDLTVSDDLTVTDDFAVTGIFRFATAQATIADDDATPDVSGGSYFISGGNTDTITDFDGTGIAVGQIIVVESDAAITYDVTGQGLVCGDTDVVTADGDSTGWFYDGTDWHCFFFQDLDDNANTWGAA